MIHLTSHEHFIQLLSNQIPFIVWFSAAWCGPCQKMDKAALDAAAKEIGVLLYYCDQTVNDETITHCNVSAFPTFAFFNRGICVAARRSADTTKVCQFIRKGTD
jgi:hypothetical protein